MSEIDFFYIPMKIKDIMKTTITEAANGGVLQIICSAAARKLKLNMIPGSKIILQNR